MRIGWRELVFAANGFGAAMLALAVSFICDLDRPYWAMMTVYVTAQPFSGALHSKALFRVAGTVIGAVMMVFLIPPLSNAPVILSLAIALWVGICLFFSLLDRTPRSYIFMIAGFTTAFIGFPIVGAPATSFDVAVSRVEENCVGIICSMLFYTIFFPRSLRLSLADRFGQAVEDLTSWCTDTFARKKDAVRRRGRLRLAADITDLHLMATNVPFDTHEPQQFGRIISTVEEKLIRLFPLITGLSERFKRLEKDGPLPQRLQMLLADISAWMHSSDPQAGVAAMKKRCNALQKLEDRPSWRDLVLFNVATRLSELVEIYASCRHLVGTMGDREALRDVKPGAGRKARVLHTDKMDALYSALSCSGIIFLGSVLWIMSGWPDGGTAIMMGTATYCLFASQANPVPAQKSMLYYTAVSSVVSGLYLFVVFPNIHSFAGLTIVLAPVFLIGGVLLAQPGGIKYLSFLVPFCGSLTLTRHFQPDFQAFLNWNVAQFVGIAGVVAATRILRNFSAHRRIQTVLQATSTDIADIARGQKHISASAWMSLMVDRIGLLAPYVDIIKSNPRYASVNTMIGMRTGLNVIRLRRALAHLPAEYTERGETLMAGLADHFYAQARQVETLAPPYALQRDFDEGLAAVSAMPANRLRKAIANALTGLRCNLFPLVPEVGA